MPTINEDTHTALLIAREQMAAQASLTALKSILLLNGACGIGLFGFISNTDGRDILSFTWPLLFFFLASLMAIFAMLMAWNEKAIVVANMPSDPPHPLKKHLSRFDTELFTIRATRTFGRASLVTGAAGFLMAYIAITP
ncbi:hypothetical protein [Pseudodesulfovibrio pelocollis]|uniref:hypothetical protein n=1 Tax=Pseudodesulfovibrio pelocollis TaxID=3051432 RepID=UPI00255AE734|nr:hypothetical protein [Pseudodesulfovibrio sp. SB368]